MSAKENIEVLMDTIITFEGRPFDTLHGGTFEEYIKKYREGHVLLPESMEKLEKMPACYAEVSGQCKITCEDTDSYTMACEMYRGLRSGEWDEKSKIMVLNFANPYISGGGVRRGVRAQEEDLCRRSSLLLSLETEEAKKYYSYNRTNMQRDAYGNDYGTDAMLLTPYVEIIKNKQYEAQSEYAQVAVLTAAAPIIKDRRNIAEDYPELLYRRIRLMLLCAAHYGYTHLVLGAWGCGAFGNEPEVVARMFRDVIEDFEHGGKDVNQLFERISFAVPYNERRPWNYRAFEEVFGGKYLV